jgi:hypothetical protein
MLEYNVHMLEYNVHMLEYNVHMLEYNVHMLEYNVHMLAYNVHMLEYNVHMLEYNYRKKCLHITVAKNAIQWEFSLCDQYTLDNEDMFTECHISKTL